MAARTAAARKLRPMILTSASPASVALALAAAAALALGRARPRWLLAWLPVAALAYLAWRGVPSLSSRDRMAALACALIAAAPALALARRDRRTLGAIAISAGGAALALAILAGAPAAMADGTPPARP